MTADDRLRVTLSSQSDAAASRLGSRILYANAVEDGDWIVAPTPTGLAIYAQLRSPAAPGELELSFDAVDAADLELKLTDDGGARVVPDGERLATISPPLAWDAQQTPVPARYALSGNTLRIAVDHRDRDVAYPVLVDPVIDNQYTWRDNPSLGIGGWAWVTVGRSGSLSTPASRTPDRRSYGGADTRPRQTA